jgi:hypothetical protein
MATHGIILMGWKIGQDNNLPRRQQIGISVSLKGCISATDE